MRILIAEDDPIAREIAIAAVCKWGHEPIACEDGEAAWQAMQGEDAPNLLLLDWFMPGLDGLEVTRRVRQQPHSRLSYIILVTTRSRQQDIVAGLESGADDYVVKPFDEEELRARLQVGARVVQLWEQLVEAERVRVLAQTAGAAAHEITQPLSILMGQIQLLQRGVGSDDRGPERLDRIYRAAERIRDIVHRMGSARRYVAKSYVEGLSIVDFEAASRDHEEEE